MQVLFTMFFVLLLIGIPIPAALGLSLYQNAIFGEGASIDFIGRTMIRSMDSFPILAVPVFILAGEIMGKGGISKRLFDFANSIIGRVTGGVPMATVLTCMLFGAISGSGPATFAAVGAIMIPLMVKQGYNKPFVTGLSATAGGLGVIIPPSLPMVMFAIAANQSIGDMFLAGIIPGVIFGVALMIYAFIYSKINKIPPCPEDMRPQPVLVSVRKGFFALLTPVIILGGIYSGYVTATEAAAVSVVYGIIVSVFVYKTIKFKDLPKMVYNAALTCGPILLIVAIATVFGRAITFEGIPRMVASALMGVSTNPVVILIILNILLLIVGMFMDTLSAIVILAPMLLPIAAAIGVSPIHFGVIMVANLAIGLVTPPIGISLYVASAITRLSIMKISKAVIGPIVAMLVALILVTAVPVLSTFIVNL